MRIVKMEASVMIPARYPEVVLRPFPVLRPIRWAKEACQLVLEPAVEVAGLEGVECNDVPTDSRTSGITKDRTQAHLSGRIILKPHRDRNLGQVIQRSPVKPDVLS